MATKYSYLSIGVFTEIILLDSLNEIGLECFVQMFVLILMNSFKLIFRNFSFCYNAGMFYAKFIQMRYKK